MRSAQSAKNSDSLEKEEGIDDWPMDARDVRKEDNVRNRSFKHRNRSSLLKVKQNHRMNDDRVESSLISERGKGTYVAKYTCPCTFRSTLFGQGSGEGNIETIGTQSQWHSLRFIVLTIVFTNRPKIIECCSTIILQFG